MNENIKSAYLSYKQLNGTSENTFKKVQMWITKIQPFEDKYNKDVCQFTADEITEMLLTYSNKSYQILKTIRAVYADYTDYCLMAHKHFMGITHNNFDDVSFDFLYEISGKESLSEERFWDIVNNCDNASDKFFLLGIFHGMTRLELMLAKYEHIHGNVIDCYDYNGGEIKKVRSLYIGKETKEYAHQSANCFERYGRKDNQMVVTGGLFGDYIIKDGKMRTGALDEYMKVRYALISHKTDNIRKNFQLSRVFIQVRNLGIALTIIDYFGRTTTNEITEDDLQAVNQKYNLQFTLQDLKKILKNYLEE